MPKKYQAEQKTSTHQWYKVKSSKLLMDTVRMPNLVKPSLPSTSKDAINLLRRTVVKEPRKSTKVNVKNFKKQNFTVKNLKEMVKRKTRSFFVTNNVSTPSTESLNTNVDIATTPKRQIRRIRNFPEQEIMMSNETRFVLKELAENKRLLLELLEELKNIKEITRERYLCKSTR